MKNFFDGTKTLLLDIDDTILDFGMGQRNAILGTLLHFGITCTEEQYADYDIINLKYWRMYERGEISKDRLSVARFEEFFNKYHFDANPSEAENQYRILLGNQAIFMDGAKEALDYLKKKYKIFLATNGIKQTQISRLALSGVDKIVDGVFISEEIGFAKPSKEFFDFIFEKTGIDRDTAVMIGDSITSDINGGKNAEIKTVWYNGKNRQKSDTIIPDCTLSSWSEVYDIL